MAYKAQGAGPRKSRLFMSYSRKDLAFAETLRQQLVDAGYDVLLDRTDIAAGEDWQARLGQLIVEADTIVSCLSPHFVASKVCSWEIAEAERLGKRILPVVLRKVPDADVPTVLSKLNFIFMDGRGREKNLTTLIDAIETDLPWLREHTRLGDLALQWQAKPGNAGVLRGAALEDAERWIASQPRGAALATDLHRSFISASRKAANLRQRNWIMGAAAIVILSLGLAGWSEINRREAVRQTALAEQQRDRAETILAAASKTASGLVFDLAQEFRDVQGVPVAVIRKILDKAQGLQTQLGEAGESTPDLLLFETAGLNELSTTLLAQGDTAGALDAARKALQQAQKLVAQGPDNNAWQRSVVVSLTIVGDALSKQGDLPAALSHFRQALQASTKRAAQNPGDGETLRDLSASHSRIADTLLAMDDLDGAVEGYEACLEILMKLVATNPNNSTLKVDASVIATKIGDIMQARAAFENALLVFNFSLGLRQQLSQAEPENTRFLYLLASSYERLGSLALAQGDTENALAQYGDYRKVAKQLAEQDPGNAEWQWDASLSEEKFGDVLAAQGNMKGALESYRKSLLANESLSVRDPGNARSMRRLFVSNLKIGETLLQLGNKREAKNSAEAAVTQIEKLVTQFPDQTEWRRDVAVAREKLGDVQHALGELTTALENYRRGKEIFETQAARDTDNASRQFSVAVSLEKMGNVLLDMGDKAGAVASYASRLEIVTKLAAADPGNIMWQRNLWVSHFKLAYAGEDARINYGKALAIMKDMQAKGTFAASDEQHMTRIEADLAALPP